MLCGANPDYIYAAVVCKSYQPSFSILWEKKRLITSIY